MSAAAAIAAVIWLVVASVARADNQAIAVTECNQQLHDYYVGLGMPMVTPVLAAFNLTSGVFLGVPYVTLTASVQTVATYYANLLPNTTLANQTYNAYYSLNVPWCASAIEFQCCVSALGGTAKTSNCTTLSDFDQGGASPVAGRLFIYANQSAGCQGDISITFRNTTVLGGGQTDTYTYDAVGIRDHVLLNPSQARYSYRRSYCQFTDGDPSDMVTQNQFVCVEPQIGCNGTRPGQTPPQLPTVPFPAFKCIGNVSNNVNTSTQTVIWTMTSKSPPGSPDSLYGIAFAPDESFGPYVAAVFAVSGIYHVLSAGTSTQFDSGFATMNHVAFIYYNGVWTAFRPLYPLSIDPIISQVPCACDFTLVCQPDGTVDYSEPSSEVLFNNVVPYCDAGPAQEIPQGTPNFTLDASLSLDPDNAPFPFTFRWAVLTTPYDPSPPPFTINATALTQQINSTGLAQGQYAFVLWASDVQTQTNCIFNLTIVKAEVFAVTEPDKIVQFTFYAGNEVAHPCSQYPPQPSIPVLGNYSYSTLDSAVLTYSWTVTDGDLDYQCDSDGFESTRAVFNTTEPILEFVPPGPGYYCFQLVVSDGVTNSTPAYVCVQVQPDFGQPPSSFTPIANYTPPPLVYFTDPPVPHIPFDNFSLPPFNTFPPGPPPPAPVDSNASDPITPVPPPTAFDIIRIAIVVAAAFLYFVLFAMLWRAFKEVNEYAFLDKKIYGGRRGTGIWSL